MNLFQAVDIIEGYAEADDAQVLEAWQFLVDSGAIESLQGAIQRKAAELIRAGLVTA